MASSIKNSSALKMVYTIGMEGEKVISKTRTISSINIDATDDHVYGFAAAMLKLQQKSAAIQRVDAEILNV